jgi:hypothetical protein
MRDAARHIGRLSPKLLHEIRDAALAEIAQGLVAGVDLADLR